MVFVSDISFDVDSTGGCRHHLNDDVKKKKKKKRKWNMYPDSAAISNKVICS